MGAPALPAVTDGTVTIRAPEPGDAAVLVAGRDAEFHRWMGDGDPAPRPTGCIVVSGEVVGWVDYDRERDWLEPGEVNVGYTLFAAHRGKGYATRAVRLLLQHLATDTAHTTATVLIDQENERSLALAARIDFVEAARVDRNVLLKRSVHPDGHQSVGV